MKNPEERRLRWMRVRMALLLLVFFAAVFAVGRRAWELQIGHAAGLRELAQAQHESRVRLSPKRGTIYDRHGADLAVSIEVDSLWADPHALHEASQSPSEVASKLASVLDVDRDSLATRLSSKRYFVWIKRHLTPQQTAAIRKLNIPGLGMSREARRFYPNRELAAHVLGFANVDGTGIEGLELSYDERLRGAERKLSAVRDRQGNIVFSHELLDARSQRGDDLILSIDKTIQHLTEQELSMAVHTSEARAGSVVVMDPWNGELLALANFPTFNPNNPADAPPSHRRNRAVTDRFEPGSTIKVFTLAGALSVGAISMNQTIDCGRGVMELGDAVLHDTHKWTRLNLREILAYSSNIGAAKIGLSLGRMQLYRMLRRFGFGERTGIPLPGETEGILRHYRKWYDMDTATISFGQGMSVDVLQLAVAMSVIANGGELMEPVLVKRVGDSRGEITDDKVPTVRRRVIPTVVARQIASMMTSVTEEEGTGFEAALDGYSVAGKTGTAQKADYIRGGYAPDKWTASFVGFAPADRPRLVIAVILDEPLIEHSGGIVAAPVFRRIAERALRHLGVSKREPRPMLQVASRAATSGQVRVKVPPSGKLPPLAPGQCRTPDFEGMTARAALRAAQKHGLVIRLQGSGVVTSQSIAPFTSTSRDAVIELVLQPLTHRGRIQSKAGEVQG